jgi:hypothetical protein
MFGLSAKLPVSEEERQWVDQGFQRLAKMLGPRGMLEAKVGLPTGEDFPDPYNKTPAAVEKLLQRVCTYMQLDRNAFDLEIFPDETEALRKTLPYWRGNSGGAAGLYTHDAAGEAEATKRMVVAIKSSQLQDPFVLVATIAHELGHVILLGRGLLNPKTEDHEPLTDLLTILLGLGVFTANCAARFIQYQDERQAGWSMQRLGYLPEQVHGYARARFAVERGEAKSEWDKHLSTNVRCYYKRSRAWLGKNPHDTVMTKPIA